MTTLSKEDVVRMAGISGISIGNSESSPYPTNFQLHAFATLSRADLVAENERLKEELQQVTISKDCYFEERNSAREAFHRRVKDVESLQSELTAARAALAAAEANNKRLRVALEYKHDSVDALMTWCVKNIDKWHFSQYDNVAYAIEKMRDALAQPRDNSALREMIAEVYAECALFIEPQRNDLPATGIEFSAALRLWAEIRLRVLAEKLS